MNGQVSRPAVRAPPRMQATRKRPDTRRPLPERSVALTAFWMRIYAPEWMTEETARADRRHSLLQDNPTSG